MTTSEPKTPLLKPLSLEIERSVAAFEAAYRADSRADLAAFLPPVNHVLYGRLLRELICVDLEFAWERGEARRLESYRARFPQLFEYPDHLREAVREEYRLRRAAGENPAPSEFGHRFGAGLFNSESAAIQSVPATVVLESAPPRADGRMPEVGQSVAGFKLNEVIGSGAFGKVFLARETGLAGRQVAIKASTRFPGEAQTLARLQHSNIVPIYSVHRHGPLHLICMPWLGGTTFADVIRSVQVSPSLPVSAQSLVSTLIDKARLTIAPGESDGSPTALASRMPPTLKQLEQSSFLEASLSFGEQLAEGLEHAHARGVLHRDLKPANILLADDGRPMLLDFNLAADAEVSPREAIGIGGTLRYMSPEGIDALQRGRAHADARADVYALGLILCELLTGRLPFDDGKQPAEILNARLKAPRLSTLRPDLPAGVISILQHCLEPNPADRYGTASELAEDLRRQRRNLPLKFAPNTSRRERIGKWARRHPRLSSTAFLVTVSAAILAVLLSLLLARLHELRQLEATNARTTLRTERDAIRMMLVSQNAPRRSALQALERSRLVLDQYGAWSSEPLVNHPLIRHLPADQQRDVLRDLGAVFAEYAAATQRLGKSETDAARKVQLLRQSEAAYERAVTLRLPQHDAVEQMLESLEQGRYRQAIETIRNAGEEISPVAWLARGHAHFQLREYLDTLRCCDVALVHSPGKPPILFQRGLALQALGRWDEAIRDFSAVLTKDADDADALLNRALCRLEKHDVAAVIRDLNQLEHIEGASSRLYFIREQARRRAGDDPGAAADFQKGIATAPTDPVSWVARGRAKLRLPTPDVVGALQDFRTSVDPAHGDENLLTGWENLAELLSERENNFAEALKAQNHVVLLHPASASGRAGRAVLHARLKQTTEANDDVAAALKLNPDSLSLYQCACARLLIAESEADRRAGFQLLKDALRMDPQWAAAMEADPDLKSVHGAAEFRKLLVAARTLQAHEAQP